MTRGACTGCAGDFALGPGTGHIHTHRVALPGHPPGRPVIGVCPGARMPPVPGSAYTPAPHPPRPPVELNNPRHNRLLREAADSDEEAAALEARAAELRALAAVLRDTVTAELTDAIRRHTGSDAA